MARLSEYLTIEALISKERFENNFHLCNYAIQLVQRLVSDGQDHFVGQQIQNNAYNTLQTILTDKDQYLVKEEEE